MIRSYLVSRADRRSQIVRGVVGKLGHIVVGVKAHQRDDGTEDLILGDARLFALRRRAVPTLVVEHPLDRDRLVDIRMIEDNQVVSTAKLQGGVREVLGATLLDLTPRRDLVKKDSLDARVRCQCRPG